MSSTGEEGPIVKGDFFIPSIFLNNQKEIVIIEKLKKEKKKCTNDNATVPRKIDTSKKLKGHILTI